MKVLLVTENYETAFPFIQNIERELNKSGVQADVLDLHTFGHKVQGAERHFAPRLFRKLVSVRKIGTLMKITMLRRYISRIKGQYDAVSIHSCEHVYYYLIRDLKKISDNTSVMIWGSDFYQISNEMREQHRLIFDTARYVVFGNPQNASDFISYYGAYKDKALVTGFGNSLFDLIREQAGIDRGRLRAEFGVPDDKIVISIGYNGREMQQHLLLLDAIGDLPDAHRQHIFLLLQAGYGTDKEYLARIIDRLESLRVAYKIEDRFLENADIAKLRLLPDIVLNAQKSDGFSSSLQEHVFAGNVLIVGDWLPYAFLEPRGVFLVRSAAAGFSASLRAVLKNMDAYRQKVRTNPAAIEAISSWKVRIQEWKDIFSGNGNLGKYKI